MTEADEELQGEVPELDMSTLAAIRDLMVHAPDDDPVMDDLPKDPQIPAAAPEPVATPRRKSDALPLVTEEVQSPQPIMQAKEPSKVKAAVSNRVEATTARLCSPLDDFAMCWDAILDRFPEGTVDALYMPDFGELAAADVRHDAVMERRLESLRES